MPESDLTKGLKRKIWEATKKQGTFGCFEVTIGWFGSERVDYMTYDTKGIWRCYEKSDFRSKNHNTFLGHFNYYVMPYNLYQQVKGEIPAHIGVHDGRDVVKKPKRQELGVDEQILKDSMIRSLCRDVDKLIRNENPLLVERYRKSWERAEKEKRELQQKHHALHNKMLQLGLRDELRSL